MRVVRGAAWACLTVVVLALSAHAQNPAKPDAALATRHLFEAVLRNNMAAIKESLAKGADLNARNARGVTPAELAVDLGYLDIANYLLALDKTRREEAERLGSTPAQAAPDAAGVKEKDKKPAKRAPKKADTSLFAPTSPTKPPGTVPATKPTKEPASVKPRSTEAPPPSSGPPTASDPTAPSDPFARYFRPLTRPEEPSTTPTTRAGASPPPPAIVPAPVPLTSEAPARPTPEPPSLPPAAETAAAEPPPSPAPAVEQPAPSPAPEAAPTPPAPVESPLPIIGKIRGPEDPAPEPALTSAPGEAAGAAPKPPAADEPDALARFFRAFASRLKSDDGRPGDVTRPTQTAPAVAPPPPPPPPVSTPAPKTEVAPETPPAAPSGGSATRFLKRVTGLVDPSDEKKREPASMPAEPAPAQTEPPVPPQEPAPVPAEAGATSIPAPTPPLAQPLPLPAPPAPVPTASLPSTPSALTPPPLAPTEPMRPAEPAVTRAEPAPPPAPPLAKLTEASSAPVPEPPAARVRPAPSAPEEPTGSFSRFFKRVTKMAGIDLDRGKAKPPPKAVAPETKPAIEPEPKKQAVETKTETPKEPATARAAPPPEDPSAAARPSVDSPPRAGERPRKKEEAALPPPQRQRETGSKNFFQRLAEWMQRDRRDEGAKALKPIPRELLGTTDEPSATPAPSATDLAALQDKSSWAPKVERGAVAPPPATSEPSVPPGATPADIKPDQPTTARTAPGTTTGETSALLGLPALPPAGAAPEGAREAPGTQDAPATLFGMPVPPATETPADAAAEAPKPAGDAFTLFGMPVPGEKKASAEAAPSGGLFGHPAAPADEAGKKEWAVKSVETAQARPQIAPAPQPEPVAVAAASSFILGRSLILGKPPPPRESEPLKDRSCIDKLNGAITFCIESANWPKSVEENFRVNTVLYTGLMAIVRYDGGVATRLQTMFPSDRFDKIVSYFTALYGSPQEYWTRSIAPLASARQDNPTRAWRARHPATSQVMVLEIRQYDDTRGGFPDTKRGVVMVYIADAKPIFPQVSSLELMRLKRLR